VGRIIDEKWCRDTGIVGVIALLLIGGGQRISVILAIIILTFALVYPRALWPLGFVWGIIADVLGFIMPRLFFGIVFLGIIVPIGMIRRAFGKDSLMLDTKRYSSAFQKRGHTFTKSDLITPF